jgi:3-dehydroquinate synthase
MRPDAVIVGLTATPERLVERVQAHATREGVVADRPLLAGDALSRMTALLEHRAPLYAQADVQIETDGLSPDDVSTRAAEALEGFVSRGLVPTIALETPDGRSDIVVATGSHRAIAELIAARWPEARNLWLITDESVAEHWLAKIESGLARPQLRVQPIEIEPGEKSKRLAIVEHLCNELTQRGATRRDVVVALGGGVVGDLAGFVAAITLRGLPVVQVPTSLLAMVDSSVGGKTGVNTPAGKNLVGAFYQPGVVVIDPTFLSSLPREEFRSGMAEVIKHALIQPSTPFGGTTLRELLNSVPLDPVPVDVLEEMLRLNVAIKHSVVQADERESGLRMMLNFGHTVGHAVEADGYRYRHGEAVAIGMVAATRIACELNRVNEDAVAATAELLQRASLPVRVVGSADEIIGRLAKDKKNVDGALNWILPNSDGMVERVTGVPLQVVERVLRELGAQ